MLCHFGDSLLVGYSFTHFRLTFVLVTSIERAEGSRKRSVDLAVNCDLSCTATSLTLEEKGIHYRVKNSK